MKSTLETMKRERLKIEALVSSKIALVSRRFMSRFASANSPQTNSEQLFSSSVRFSGNMSLFYCRPKAQKGESRCREVL
jgi:hypothetical protein